VEKRKRFQKIPKKYLSFVEGQLENLGTQIRTHREEMGWTQQDLAEHLDLAVMTIQFIEQGRRHPSLPLLFYICKALKIPVKIG
jgi:putative transcriptional regulator